jgi:hypothetical protein
MIEIRFRRLAGLLLGAGLGACYGVVSQYINAWNMPGLPLYQPPLGPAFNALLAVLLGALLGGIAAWPFASLRGVFTSVAVGSVLVQIAWYLDSPEVQTFNIAKLLTVLIFIFPIAGVLTVVIGAFRWLLNKLVEMKHDREPWPKPALLALLSLALLGGLGWLWAYPPQGRQVLTRMHAMLQAAQQAGPGGSYPAELTQVSTERFSSFGSGAAYQLDYETQNIDRFGIPRVGAGSWQESAVIAYFSSGWQVVCIYPAPDKAPECKDFVP